MRPRLCDARFVLYWQNPRDRFAQTKGSQVSPLGQSTLDEQIRISPCPAHAGVSSQTTPVTGPSAIKYAQPGDAIGGYAPCKQDIASTAPFEGQSATCVHWIGAGFPLSPLHDPMSAVHATLSAAPPPRMQQTPASGPEHSLGPASGIP